MHAFFYREPIENAEDMPVSSFMHSTHNSSLLAYFGIDWKDSIMCVRARTESVRCARWWQCKYNFECRGRWNAPDYTIHIGMRRPRGSPWSICCYQYISFIELSDFVMVLDIDIRYGTANTPKEQNVVLWNVECGLSSALNRDQELIPLASMWRWSTR